MVAEVRKASGQVTGTANSCGVDSVGADAAAGSRQGAGYERVRIEAVD